MFCTFDRGLLFWSGLLVLKFTAAVGVFTCFFPEDAPWKPAFRILKNEDCSDRLEDSASAVLNHVALPSLALRNFSDQSSSYQSKAGLCRHFTKPVLGSWTHTFRFRIELVWSQKNGQFSNDASINLGSNSAIPSMSPIGFGHGLREICFRIAARTASGAGCAME